jgi:hypothetical protein
MTTSEALMSIKTDNKWRYFKYGYELPAKVRKQFDWMVDEEYESSLFFRYKRHWYAVDEFMSVPRASEFHDWDGYHQDSYFSGTLIKISTDGERYKVGYFYS